MRRTIEVPVGDLMSAPALTVKPETPIEELTRLFVEHEFNGLPVVNDAAGGKVASSRGGI
jgi:CBS domain-containing protein